MRPANIRAFDCFKKNSEQENLRPSCPNCKIQLAKDRNVERHVDTTEGWVGYERMRYQCRRCGQGYYPLDFGLELAKDSRMSRKKERTVAHLAARVPYEEAKQIYEELTHLTIGAMTIHRSVQKLGSKLKEKEPKLRDLPGVGKKHVTADGVMVHI